jgi:signal transduction histidine kinase
LSAAIAIAVYYAERTRRLRQWIAAADNATASLGHEVAELVEHTVPTVAQGLRTGASVQTVLAGVARPSDAGLDRLLQMVTREIGGGEAAVRARVALQDDAARLADKTVPEMVQRLRAGASVEAVSAEVVHPSEVALERLLQTVLREIDGAQRRGTAALAGCASAAARVQSQTTRMLADLRELEHMYSEEKVFADLLGLDHRISQLDRLADSIALLSGGRSGRRWTKPIVMESIVRGALGRIDAYRRVRVHSASTLAVAGYAAEGVMHVLAEVMDNATSFSAHGTEVHVYVQEEDAGVVVMVEDSGLGMRRRERQRAEALVAGSFDLTTLSGTRLGLAAVGRLARRYGLGVSFRPSSRGGTAVVVMIPGQLIKQSRPEGRLGPAAAEGADLDSAMVPGGAAAADSAGGFGTAGSAEDAEPAGTGGMGRLPKRTRGQTLADSLPPPRPQPAPMPHDPGPRFAAFRQATERRDQPGATIPAQPGSLPPSASPAPPGSAPQPGSPVQPGSQVQPAGPAQRGSPAQPGSPVQPGSAVQPGGPAQPGTGPSVSPSPDMPHENSR